MDILLLCLIGIFVAGVIIVLSLYGLMTGLMFGALCLVVLAVYVTDGCSSKRATASTPAPPMAVEKAPAPEPPPLAKAPEPAPDPAPAPTTEENQNLAPPAMKSPSSLGDDLSAQEQAIRQKVNGVLELLGQLKQLLESGEVESRDEIRNRLKAISDGAISGSSQLKQSSELSRIKAVLDRFEEDSQKNQRLSEGARQKSQELLRSKRQMLERLEKLSIENLKKLLDYEGLSDTWLSDFDTIWKIDGLKQASKQLLGELSKLQEIKDIGRSKVSADIPQAVAIAEPVIENPLRNWTTIHGILVNGRIQSVDRTHVMLEGKDGKVVQLPLALLFPEDQKIILELFSPPSGAPSQGPERDQSAKGTMFVAQKTPDGYLNVRMGPGLNYSIAGRIPSGAGGILQIGETILDRKEQIIWMPVRFGNVTGYVSAGFLKPSTERPKEQTRLPQPVPAKDHINSLGMKFVPVPGTQVMMCIHETRNVDYTRYELAKAGFNVNLSAYEMGKRGIMQRWGSNAPAGSWQSRAGPGYEQHPVVNVHYEDALSFCRWLSAKEGLSYRLPTDSEWSVAVGLQPEAGETPEEKSRRGPTDVFPWGSSFPPFRSGNYQRTLSENGLTILEDGFQYTAPVMRFRANRLGIFDLGGNVSEWCQDWYNPRQDHRVVRGGSFSTYQKRDLLRSAHRGGAAPSQRMESRGFRCVLVVHPD